MIRILVVTLLLWAASAVTPAYAADSGEIFDHDKRIALSEKMLTIKPAREQLERAIDSVAAQRVPADKREAFTKTMMDSIDYESLEKKSVEAMAEIFTVAELEKMVDYFGSEEAKSITEKLPVYQALIQPELAKVIDEALMKVRVGDIVDGSDAVEE